MHHVSRIGTDEDETSHLCRRNIIYQIQNPTKALKYKSIIWHLLVKWTSQLMVE